MKRYSLVCKTIAFFLACISFFLSLICGYGIITLVSADMYQDYPDSLAQPLLSTEGRKLASSVAQYYAATEIGGCPTELVNQLYEDLPYTIYNLSHSSDSFVSVTQGEDILYSLGSSISDGIVFDNYELTVRYPVLVPQSGDDPSEDEPETTEAKDADRYTYKQDIVVNGQAVTCEYYYESITLTATVTFHKSRLNNTNYQLLSTFYPYRNAMIAGLILSLITGISLVIYLLWVAGRDLTAQSRLIGLNRLPLDLYLLIAAGLSQLWYQGFYAFVDTIYDLHLLIFNLSRIALAVPLLLGFLYILAAQSKFQPLYWFHHSLIGRLIQLCRKALAALIRVLPVIWQWLIVATVLLAGTVISFVYGFAYEGRPVLRLVFLLCLVATVALICYCGYCFGVILAGAKKMAQGKLDHKIPESTLWGAFKDCAVQLNSLSGSANAAMQSQIRSERMKTELITNVSHDIKTPLTSIINFVDLLEKPHSEEDTQQYLEILSRQSQLLKKLIEDLMELSKANSGNISVNLTTLDAVEAVNQALGEFSDKLDAAQVLPVLRIPEEPLFIQADGRLLWRVLSNLLSNAVKYAAPNSRLYVDVEKQEQQVLISLRNISKDELTVSAEELLERFVRGDISRNTEGSGLGLNIAQSLMEVQQGNLSLLLDGDIFKVTLTFPTP